MRKTSVPDNTKTFDPLKIPNYTSSTKHTIRYKSLLTYGYFYELTIHSTFPLDSLSTLHHQPTPIRKLSESGSVLAFAQYNFHSYMSSSNVSLLVHMKWICLWMTWYTRGDQYLENGSENVEIPPTKRTQKHFCVTDFS